MPFKSVVMMMVLAGLGGVSVGAHNRVVAAESQTKTGTVKKVDAAARQIVVLVARELTFSVTDATKILYGDKDIKLADIEVGASVTVDYSKDGDTRAASKIVVAKKEDKKEPKKD